MEILIASILALLGLGGILLSRKKSSSPVYGLPNPLSLTDQIKNEMKLQSIKRNIPLELIIAQVKKESGGGERIDRIDALGSAGEIGLMQIKAPVLIDYNRYNATNWSSDRLWDWPFNLEVGCWYLSYLKNRFGSWRSALIAYNIGPTKFAKEGENPTGASYAATILSWAGLA